MKKSLPPLMSERHKIAIHLREMRRYSFREIGQRLGVGASRAHAIYQAAIFRREYTPECFYTLSVRTVQVLENLNLRNREEVLAAVTDGRLSLKRGPRNYGKKGLWEILNWLDLSKP